MRRIMLLALLALALSTAALANSISSTDATLTIPFSCPTSSDCRILSGHPNFTTMFYSVGEEHIGIISQGFSGRR